MNEWWTIGGAIASFMGAFFSWIQAIKAKGYAQGISDGKKVAKDRNLSTDLSEFNYSTREIKNQLGPAYADSKTAAEVQTMLNNYMTEYSKVLGSMDEKAGKALNELYESINIISSKLADNAKKNDDLSRIQYLLGRVILEATKIISHSNYI